jgi:hypothetical protein
MKRNGSKNTTNLSEHIISTPSTHSWAMGNFHPSNGNPQFSLLIPPLSPFSDCNGIKKLHPLITKLQRKKGKYVVSKLDLSLFNKRKFVGSVLDSP